MPATDPTQPIAAGWCRLVPRDVHFPQAQVFFDMQSDRISARLDDFEEYCASAAHPMKSSRLRYTKNGAVAVAMIAEESLAFGDVTREVVCTAALWMFVYEQPVALPIVPDLSRENRNLLDWHIKQSGGFVLNCVAGANAWSFKVSPIAAAAMPEMGLPHGATMN